MLQQDLQQEQLSGPELSFAEDPQTVGLTVNSLSEAFSISIDLPLRITLAPLLICWARTQVFFARSERKKVSFMLVLTALAAAAVVGTDLVERRVHISRTRRSTKSGRLPTETDCGGPWIYASACRHAKVRQQPFMCQVCRSWAALDRVVLAHEGNLSSKVSGDLVRHETNAAQAIQLVQSIIKRNGAATVCETGFNAGHSALLFLALPYADARTSRSISARHRPR